MLIRNCFEYNSRRIEITDLINRFTSFNYFSVVLEPFYTFTVRCKCIKVAFEQ